MTPSSCSNLCKATDNIAYYKKNIAYYDQNNIYIIKVIYAHASTDSAQGLCWFPIFILHQKHYSLISDFFFAVNKLILFALGKHLEQHYQ